jgi:predicted NACHT family NTPase
MTSEKITLIGRSLFTIFVTLASVSLKGITQSPGVIILDLLIGTAPSYLANLLGDILPKGDDLSQSKLKQIITQAIKNSLNKIAREYNIDSNITEHLTKKTIEKYLSVLYQEINQITDPKDFIEAELSLLKNNVDNPDLLKKILTEDLAQIFLEVNLINTDHNSLISRFNQELSQQIYQVFIQKMPQEYINKISINLLNDLKKQLQNLAHTINSNLAVIDQNMKDLADNQNIILSTVEDNHNLLTEIVSEIQNLKIQVTSNNYNIIPEIVINWRSISQQQIETIIKDNPVNHLLAKTTKKHLVNLEKMYIPLAVVKREQQPTHSYISLDQGSQLYSSHQEDLKKNKLDHQTFLEKVIKPGEKIAILGEAGAGKTTLLKIIAKEILSKTDDLVIWISLHELHGKNLEDYLLNNWLREQLKTIQINPVIQQQLVKLFSDKKVWLILDGLDEVELYHTAKNKIQLIQQQITKGWLGDAKIILSCRLNVWDVNTNFISDQFDIYLNCNFNDEDIEQFIDNFFGDQTSLADSLKQQVMDQDNSNLKDTIQNPLRLVLLCWIFDQHSGSITLSLNKAQLYHQFVKALYDWNRQEFDINETQQEDLNLKLSELAFVALERESLPYRISLELLKNKLDDFHYKKALELSLINRVGVAENDPLSDVYAFYHPTFQTYFAAHKIQDDWQLFFNHIPDNPVNGKYLVFKPQWREIIMFWLGIKRENFNHKIEFFKALLQFEDNCHQQFSFYWHLAYKLVKDGVKEIHYTVEDIIDLLDNKSLIHQRWQQFTKFYEDLKNISVNNRINQIKKLGSKPNNDQAIISSFSESRFKEILIKVSNNKNFVEQLELSLGKNFTLIAIEIQEIYGLYRLTEQNIYEQFLLYCTQQIDYPVYYQIWQANLPSTPCIKN